VRPALALLSLLAAGCAAPPPLPAAPGTIRPDAPGRFILLGDTQKTMTLEFWRPHYDAERKAVIQAVLSESPAFVINSGDLVCHGGRREDWRRFCDENEVLFSGGIAYFPALGNHDYYGGAESALRFRAEVFPHLGTRRWYEVGWGAVRIAILDSNFDELGAEEIRDQDRWLEERLRAAEADAAVHHVLLVCHHPPYTNAKGLAESRDVRDHFVSRLTPKVRVFASGHVHNYERFEKNGVQFLVSGGGGGPTRDLETEHPGHDDRYRGARERPFHYCRFSLRGGTLACDVFMLQKDDSWRRVDGFECSSLSR
jgi:predicted MPP superfamily phosphohydrolase